MAHKAAETTHNINSTSGLLTNTKCSGGSRNFAKQTSLEDEERSGQPLKVDNDQLRATIEADSLATVWESCQRTQIDHMAIWHLKRTGKVKKLNKGVPRELTTNQKYCHCEVSSSLLCNNDEPRLDQTVTWDKKWIVYDNRWWSTQWLDQEEAPKHFPKPNLHQKRVMVTVRWSAARLIQYSFLNPKETITPEKHAQQINEMAPKTVLSAAGTGQQHGPNSFPRQCPTAHGTTQPFKSWTN